MALKEDAGRTAMASPGRGLSRGRRVPESSQWCVVRHLAQSGGRRGWTVNPEGGNPARVTENCMLYG
jgi:hypothetical protein